MKSASDLINEANGLRTHHSAMRSIWDEAARLASPVTSEYLVNDATAPPLIRQLSACAVEANRDLASGLMSWVIPEAGNWWKWEPVRALRDREGVKRWLHECSEIAHDILRGSNFYIEAYSYLLQRNTTGTATIWMRTREDTDIINGTWDDDSPLTFETCPASDILIAEDARGRINRWYRTVTFSGRQAVEEFGDKAPEYARAHASTPGKEENRSEYLHCIYKRRQAEGKTAQEAMPWASVWVCPKTKTILKNSGYARQPIFTARWERWSRRSPYGISPAQIALGEIRGYNYFEALLTTLAEVTVEPRIQVPTEHDSVIDLGPGGVTRVMSPDAAPKEWATQGRLDWGLDFLATKEKRINSIFLRDVFAQFSTMDDGQRTAYEISKRLVEKLSRVAPATGMLTSDFFNPMLESLFHWAYTSGQFPPAPADAWVVDALGRPEMPFPEVIQTNRLSREQSAETEQAIVRIMTTLQPIAALVGPEIYDSINMDRVPQALAIEAGLKSDLIRSPEEIEAVKTARAQQQQQQQIAEAAMQNPEAAMGIAQSMGMTQ